MPEINTGQEALFLLVCKKLKEKQIIQHEEIKEIYTSMVQRYEYTNEHYWNQEKGEWSDRPRKYYEWEIDNLITSWLLRALGALIKKGYLTVIPRIKFPNQLESAERPS